MSELTEEKEILPGKPVNRGKKWTLVDDMTLYGDFVSGAEIPELASRYDRSIAGIRGRLRRLNLISRSGERIEPAPEFHPYIRQAKKHLLLVRSCKEIVPVLWEWSPRTALSLQLMISQIINDLALRDTERYILLWRLGIDTQQKASLLSHEIGVKLSLAAEEVQMQAIAGFKLITRVLYHDKRYKTFRQQCIEFFSTRDQPVLDGIVSFCATHFPKESAKIYAILLMRVFSKDFPKNEVVLRFSKNAP